MSESLHYDLILSPITTQTSRPRCMCHNKYLDKCPKTAPKEAERITDIMSQIGELDVQQIYSVTPRPEHLLRCNKVGHRSWGAAEAHMRHLERLRERGDQPDWKYNKKLEVYKCRWKNCLDSGKPFHVGHERGVK